MAAALVGSLGVVTQGAAGAAVTPAYGQAPTASNHLKLWLVGRGGSSNPTTPAGWSVDSQTLDATNHLSATLFSKTAAGADSAPTIALVTSMVWSAQLGEFSGCATSSPVDQAGSVLSGASPSVASCAAPDAAIGELVAYAVCMGNAVQTMPTAASTGTNYTAHDTNNDATSTAAHYVFGYGITTAHAVADKNSCVFDATSDNAAQVIASFLLASASVPSPQAIVVPSQAVVRSAEW